MARSGASEAGAIARRSLPPRRRGRAPARGPPSEPGDPGAHSHMTVTRLSSATQPLAPARRAASWLDATAAVRYGVATAIAILAILATVALDLAGLNTGFLLLVPAVVVSALLGGVGPGVL